MIYGQILLSINAFLKFPACLQIPQIFIAPSLELQGKENRRSCKTKKKSYHKKHKLCIAFLNDLRHFALPLKVFRCLVYKVFFFCCHCHGCIKHVTDRYGSVWLGLESPSPSPLPSPSGKQRKQRISCVLIRLATFPSSPRNAATTPQVA